MHYLDAVIYLIGTIVQFIGIKFIFNLGKKALAVMIKELNERNAAKN